MYNVTFLQRLGLCVQFVFLRVEFFIELTSLFPV